MVRLWTREYSPFALMADFNGSIKTAQINGSLQQITSTAHFNGLFIGSSIGQF
jgi:hypothetical protein